MRAIEFVSDILSDAIFYLRHRLFVGILYTELVDYVKESSVDVYIRADWPVMGTTFPISLDRVIGLHKGQLVSVLIGQGYSLALEVRKSWYSSRIRPYLHLIPPIRITPEELESALTSARKNMKEKS